MNATATFAEPPPRSLADTSHYTLIEIFCFVHISWPERRDVIAPTDADAMLVDAYFVLHERHAYAAITLRLF